MKASNSILIFLALASLASLSAAKGQSRQLLPEEQNTVDVFQHASPAVVHINAQQHLTLKFEDITPKDGIGTGFFFDREGHILTNFHVIEGSNQVEVVLNDGRRLKAILVGIAPGMDLAVLSVSPAPIEITPLRFGDSDSLLIGQEVLAVGHPLALHNTLTDVAAFFEHRAQNKTRGGRNGLLKALEPAMQRCEKEFSHITIADLAKASGCQPNGTGPAVGSASARHLRGARH